MGKRFRLKITEEQYNRMAALLGSLGRSKQFMLEYGPSQDLVGPFATRKEAEDWDVDSAPPPTIRSVVSPWSALAGNLESTRVEEP